MRVLNDVKKIAEEVNEDKINNSFSEESGSTGAQVARISAKVNRNCVFFHME